MADFVFNIAKGYEAEYYRRVKENDPGTSAFVLIILKLAEADDTLKDYDDLQALLNAAGNTECDFTNYARKTLTDVELAALPSPDDTNNRLDLALPNQTYSSAGGATNNDTVKAIAAYDPDTGAGDDSTLIPWVGWDYVRTTDGSDLPLDFNSAGAVRIAD